MPSDPLSAIGDAGDNGDMNRNIGVSDDQEESSIINASGPSPAKYDATADEDGDDDAYVSTSAPTGAARKPPIFLSTSICDMFQTRTYSQSDACALACCGIWLWERNQYMMDGTIPKSYKERPLVLIVASIIIIGLVLASTSRVGSILSDDVVSYIILGLAFAMLMLLFGFQGARSDSRRQLATFHYTTFQRTSPSEQHDDTNLMNDPSYHQFMNQHRQQIMNGHACIGCYTNDLALYNNTNNRLTNDFCAKLWKNWLQQFFCQCCCNCWCIFCGICATAQEHRHLMDMSKFVAQNNANTTDFMERSMWRRDYITFQPWDEYIPRIQHLRDTSQTSLFAHIRAMSRLSNRLLKAVGCVIVFVLVWTLLPFTTITFWQFLVLIGTLLQPTILLYIIYWSGNRFDISLDAIIKYFASGFVICTGMAFIYEILVSTFISLIVLVSAIIGSFFFYDDDPGKLWDESSPSDAITGNNDNDNDNDNNNFELFLQIFSAFLNAFIVAALVEEISKYLCYWMMEHPDLQLHDNNDNNDTIVSKSAAITIAMTTTALGFSCSENLMYVFVYTPPGIQSEIATLVARSIVPLHPLVAAIQSIGVCYRELEMRTTSKNGNANTMYMGRILFPAWFIHGLFDFVLFVLAIMYGDDDNNNNNNNNNNDEGNGDKNADGKDDGDLDEENGIPAFSIAIGIFVVALIYYIVQANAQRKRLMQQEAGGSRNAIVNGGGGGGGATTNLSNQVV